MRAKVTFTKNFDMKISTKETWTPDPNTRVTGKKSNGTRKMKNVNFAHKRRPKNSIIT